jgi:hypothetical protein
MMVTTTRLASISANFATAFLQCEQGSQTLIAWTICRRAGEENGLEPELIKDIAAELEHSRGDRARLRQLCNECAKRSDAEYFALVEKFGPTSAKISAPFRLARAHAAFAFLLSDKPGCTHEALYEAIAASADRDGAIQASMRLLAQHRTN